MRKIVLLLLLSLVASVVGAENVFRFVDASTNQPISDSYVLLRLYDERNTQFDVSGSTQQSALNFVKEKGNYAIGIYVDDLSTPGKDYYRDFRTSLDGNSKFDVTVLPVGSLQGRVLIDGVIASYAQLSFDCEKDFGLKYPKATDDLGYFSIAYFPPGTCRVHGSSGDRFGILMINITPGAKEEIIVNLDQRKSKSSLLWIVIGIVIIIAIGVVLWKRKPVKKQSLSEVTSEQAQAAVELLRRTPDDVVKRIEQDKRIQDILATLSKDERDIVEFLIRHKFKASQPMIWKKTGIPKTSLARQLISLEAKKIVSTQKNRKVKEAELTDWFLSGHKEGQ
ncbi:MAG TPA: hypothetical protein VJJ82_05545 [Candidatus Nanoarchaeia archaeon]|nr:hypothetical protein [Candidatus Nanoarchaeia archaeon]